jgi:hypothetical protein
VITQGGTKFSDAARRERRVVSLNDYRRPVAAAAAFVAPTASAEPFPPNVMALSSRRRVGLSRRSSLSVEHVPADGGIQRVPERSVPVTPGGQNPAATNPIPHSSPLPRNPDRAL